MKAVCLKLTPHFSVWWRYITQSHPFPVFFMLSFLDGPPKSDHTSWVKTKFPWSRPDVGTQCPLSLPFQPKYLSQQRLANMFSENLLVDITVTNLPRIHRSTSDNRERKEHGCVHETLLADGRLRLHAIACYENSSLKLLTPEIVKASFSTEHTRTGDCPGFA